MLVYCLEIPQSGAVSGYDKLELKHKNLVFFKLIQCIIQKKICHGVKQYAKNIEQNVIN